MLPSLLTAVTLALWARQAYAASASDWQKRTVYQVMTDRFALPPAQDSTGAACDTGAQLPCGGTWAGIENHLDYIQAMGFDAIWISPIVAQLQVPLPPPADGTAYHGYWPENIYALNDAFGTEADLRSLVSAVHGRGMYIMVDVVVNHMATYNTTAANAAPTDPLAGISLNGYNPFDEDSDYHPFCPITNYGNQTMVEQCWLGSAAVPLADVNTEDQTTVNTYYSWIGQVVSNYTFDGLRIDTVKHIRQDFWPGFVQAAGVFTLGEVLDSDAQYVGDYTNYVDAVFDYPGWGMVLQAFQTTGGSMSMLAQSIQNTSTYYKNGGFSTGSFLENHDQPRFPSLTNDTGLIKNAIAWTFIGDGLPIVYEGQEQEYSGGNVPNNREAVWLSAYQENKPMYKHITTLNNARKAAMNGSSSFLSTHMSVISTSTHSIAIAKAPMLAVLTNVGQGAQGQVSLSVSSLGSGYAANSQLVDVISCSSVKVDGSGNLAFTTQAGAPAVFLPSSVVNTKVCASVAGGSGSGSGSGAQAAFSTRAFALSAAVGSVIALLVLASA
ncbi:glycoside hydrolase family 13 protein [Calocera cornea HHB12733]|uniref:alpha-amylase n=1 Tax=Calocera cornea HHB12733 TaxID=1353952 RepID=A0A165EV28_9BASI|nr:glycoside hydrolase family 13 protein [Calocera cornea HHB12733]